jgi:hypothetical protein
MYRGCVVIAVIGCFCETLGLKIVARPPGSIFYSAWCSVFLFKLLVSDMVFLALFLAMSPAETAEVPVAVARAPAAAPAGAGQPAPPPAAPAAPAGPNAAPLDLFPQVPCCLLLIYNCCHLV